MTAKERLREIVESLDDEQAECAVTALGAIPAQGIARPRPKSLGLGASGRSDLSEKVDEILAAGFGR